jgi:cell division protein ZapA
MAQVKVTIAGRDYRVACDEGEEDHLGDLSRIVDARIHSMRERFGEIGDQRLTVMAAITIADELADSQRRIGELQAALDALRDEAQRLSAGGAAWAERVAHCLDAATVRIERAAQTLNTRP